jgi:hypothetical protein
MKTKMIKVIYATIMMLFLTGSISAQTGSVGINNNGSSPDGSAMLDVSSTTKGLLPPRMTYAQKSAIANPSAGLIVWCSNCGAAGELQIYNGTIWTSLTAGTASGLPGAPTIGTATEGPAQAKIPFTAPASNGGSTITSYTATSTPGSFTGTLTQAGSGTITVTGLTNGTAYTFTVTATSATGTGAASAASNSVTPILAIGGQIYGGGIIAYILKSGDPGYIAGETHGLIAATENQSDGIIWAITAHQSTSVPGGTSNLIGTGLANTNKIITQNGAGTTYAAGLARAYTGGGYSDWYLPSQDELEKLYAMKELGYGDFAHYYYWSSSEHNANYAVTQTMSNGIQDYYNKGTTHYVRAVRAF